MKQKQGKSSDKIPLKNELPGIRIQKLVTVLKNVKVADQFGEKDETIGARNAATGTYQ
jgi:hypothetical protein